MRLPAPAYRQAGVGRECSLRLRLRPIGASAPEGHRLIEPHGSEREPSGSERLRNVELIKKRMSELMGYGVKELLIGS